MVSQQLDGTGDQAFAWDRRLHNATVRGLQLKPSEGEAQMLSVIVLEQFVEALPRETEVSVETAVDLANSHLTAQSDWGEGLSQRAPVGTRTEAKSACCHSNPFVADLLTWSPTATGAAPEPRGAAQKLRYVIVMFCSTSSVSLVTFIPALFPPVSGPLHCPVYLSPQFLSVPCFIVVSSSDVFPV